MGYDPKAGNFTPLQNEEDVKKFMLERPWGTIFTVGEVVNVKGNQFEVAEIGEKRLILKPVKQ